MIASAMATTQPDATVPSINDAEALVDGLGIPDEVLCAPIGVR
jgi:hypothetical protein